MNAKLSCALPMVLIVLSLVALPACAQPELWTWTYGGNDQDIGYDVEQTSDGGFIIVGMTYSFGAGSRDVYLIKTNVNGIPQWTRTFGGADYDLGQVVHQTSDGGYIILAYTESFGAGDRDIWLIKTDVNGNQIWTNTIGGSNYDEGRDLQIVEGGYIIVGETASYGAGGCDAWLIKTDALGYILWDSTYGGSDYDYGFSVQPTLDSGYIVEGHTYSYGAGECDAWLFKTDALGTLEWYQTYGGPLSDYGWGGVLYTPSDGGYIIGGWTYSFGAGNSDVWLIKTDSLGNSLWTTTYGGSAWEQITEIRLCESGEYIFSACTESFGYGGSDFWIVQTDDQGNQQWSFTVGGVNDEYSGGIEPTNDSGYVIIGQTYSYGVGDDVFLVHISAQPVSFTLTPINPPIVIPATGGSFNFLATIINGEDLPLTFDVWIMVQLPNQTWYGPVLGPINLTLPANTTLTRLRTQNVPASAPAGDFLYEGRLGLYPETVWVSDSIQFTKSGSDQGASIGNWNNCGESLEASTTSDQTASSFTLSAYPLPFNPTATLSFELTVASVVKLEVFDVKGRVVGVQNFEPLQAGSHQITFDGSDLPSGLYFAKLRAGEQTAVRKLVLLK